MSFVKRVVFDTSTQIGAMLMPDSTPRKALEAAVLYHELCCSEATLAELETVIARKKFDRYLDQKLRVEFFNRIRRHTRMFSVSELDESYLPVACRDPRDDKFLALALVCQADVIVSSDSDLTTLHPYQGITVITATEFLGSFINM